MWSVRLQNNARKHAVAGAGAPHNPPTIEESKTASHTISLCRRIDHSIDNASFDNASFVCFARLDFTPFDLTSYTPEDARAQA
jgi:hypothetical protein